MRFYITASIYKLDLEAAHKFYSVGNVTFFKTAWRSQRDMHNNPSISNIIFRSIASINSLADTKK